MTDGILCDVCSMLVGTAFGWWEQKARRQVVVDVYAPVVGDKLSKLNQSESMIWLLWGVN